MKAKKRKIVVIGTMKMCKDCKQMYLPVLKDDGDTCPACARY